LGLKVKNVPDDDHVGDGGILRARVNIFDHLCSIRSAISDPELIAVNSIISGEEERVTDPG
jgi:hypothetical protein